MRLPAILMLLALSIAGSAFAQTPAPIGLATRLVVVYSRFEHELAESADKAKLEARLAPDFEEMHVTKDGAEPAVEHIPRDAWIAARLGGGAAPSIGQMAVHDQGDIRIVSYTALTKDRQEYIVDVWKGSELQPLLATRYRAAL
jgi:hypothetical protein